MKAENILAVIEELGSNIINQKTTISIKDYEIEKLKAKIEKIESYCMSLEEEKKKYVRKIRC